MSDTSQDTTTLSDETETTEETTPLVSKEDIEKLFASRGTERLRQQRELGVVNPIMLARVLGIQPQMVYNYIRNGKIKAVKTNNTQKLVIDAGEAARFAQEYMERKAQKAAKVQEELAGK